MKAKTIRQIELKRGEVVSVVIPEGTELDLTFTESVIKTEFNERPIRLSYRNAHQNFSDFTEAPSIEQLQEWSNDGTCETPLGNTTEPDGYDEHGCPSWMLIMGLI
jgi:hypothetical protein